MREKIIELKLKKLIEKNNGLCIKISSPGSNGMPDRLCIFKQKLVFVELKCPGGKVRELQRWQHAKLRSQGQQVEVISNLEELGRFADKYELDF